MCAESVLHSPCLFEFVYFSRPDSIIDSISVHKSRLRMGDFLGEKILKDYSHLKIDAVIPVPDTSRTSAMQVAYKLGVKYREGFIKNRYIGRTFIMPGQSIRKRSVAHKLSPIEIEFKNKNVLLVDDSIVRGNTSKKIVEMVRKQGAKNVYFASAAPPVRHQNVYGIDMPATKELVAHGKTIEEIKLFIGSDELIYQDIEDLRMAAHIGNPKITIPESVIVSESPDKPGRVTNANSINENESIFDIAPKSLFALESIINNAGTILWNGPLGFFEKDNFAMGTITVAKMIISSKGFSVAGGGDTISAAEKAGVLDSLDYVSTAGGAFLEFMEGRKLPAIEALIDKAD